MTERLNWTELDMNNICLWKLTTSCLLLWTDSVPLTFICWRPDHQHDGIWRWDLWEVIKFRWGQVRRMGPSWWDLFCYKEILENLLLFSLSLSLLCEDTERRQFTTSKEESSHWTMLAPWFWTFRLKEVWENKLLLFKPLNLGILLWHWS